MRAAWLLVIAALAAAGAAGIALAARVRWRESDAFASLLLAIAAVSACVLNEVLMGVVPMPWAFFYFPVRTVGLPMMAVFAGAFGLWRVSAGPGIAVRAGSALTMTVAVGVIWFCWRYPAMLFFDLHDHPVRHR